MFRNMRPNIMSIRIHFKYYIGMLKIKYGKYIYHANNPNFNGEIYLVSNSPQRAWG